MRARLLLPVAAALVGFAVCASSATAAAPALYNDLNGVTFSDTPYTSISRFDATTDEFDNDAFDESSGEESNPGMFLGCNDQTPEVQFDTDYGSKTAWVRFRTAVSGYLNVNVDSSRPGPDGYDVMYNTYTSDVHGGTATVNDLEPAGCANLNTGVDENPTYFLLLPANKTIYIQSLSVCETDEPFSTVAYPCDSTEQTSAPGGPTTIHVRFDPRDIDNDGVPDSLDSCPNDAGSQANGCNPTPPAQPAAPTDPDGDGVAAGGDLCPTQRGVKTDGCPDTDRDGVTDRVDIKCKLTPGNGLDGCPTSLDVDTSAAFKQRGRSWILRRLVIEATRGSTLEVRCRTKRKRRCLRGVKRIKRTKKAKTNLARFFRRRRLPVGAVIEVTVKKALFRGKRIRYTLTRTGYKRTIGCVLSSRNSCTLR